MSVSHRPAAPPPAPAVQPRRAALALFGRASLRRLAIARAIPDGAVRAGQAAFLRAVQECPEAALLRSDAYRNLLAVVWVLARHADWTSCCARPTWVILCARTGLSRSTVAKYLSLLRAWRLIGVVETGSTEATRGFLPEGHPDRIEGNRAAEYVLCKPAPVVEDARPDQAVEGTRTPSCLRQEAGEDPTRGRASRTGTEPENQTGSPQGRGRRAAELALCAQLQADDLTLRRVSDRMLRHLLTPLLAAGATAGDVRHVLHHRPDGTAWTYTATPAHVPGWIRWRLAHWLNADGTLRAELPSTAAARRRAHAHADQAARRAQSAAERHSATTDPHARAAAARALLAAASPSARKVIARTHQPTSGSEDSAGAA